MYLIHHGVPGQHWGVRHGPPYPIDGTGDITIKEGTSFKRLSIHNENAAKGHAYVTYLKKDSEHYAGFFGARLKAMNKNAEVYSIDMSASKDLRAPSKAKRIQTFLDMYKSDPVIATELGSYHKSDSHYFTPLPKKYYQKKYSDMDAEALRSKGYETFVRSLGGNEYIRNSYFSRLANEGYHFVTDDMDAGRFGKEPSIIFKREDSVVYKGQKKLATKDILKSWAKNGTRMKELQHHGILGMKWGIRRFQPYDDGLFLKVSDVSGFKSLEKREFGSKARYRTGNMSAEEFARAKELWNSVDELNLPQSEKEYIYEEFDNNLRADEKSSAIVSRPINNHQYTAINLGHNQYKIINKELIDSPLTDDIIDEVLTEMFGSDWRDQLDD